MNIQEEINELKRFKSEYSQLTAIERNRVVGIKLLRKIRLAEKEIKEFQRRHYGKGY
jgi:hypothetical protein